MSSLGLPSAHLAALALPRFIGPKAERVDTAAFPEASGMAEDVRFRVKSLLERFGGSRENAEMLMTLEGKYRDRIRTLAHFRFISAEKPSIHGVDG